MISGQMVVLKDGDLATAMRASMAIPGAFAPVVTDKYILSDGGMVRNIPVDVARNLCADVVIVVNLVEEEVKREKLQTATQLLSRSTDVMIVANENLQLDSLTDRDIRIDVIMGDITTTDFERVPETVPLGEKAAREMAAKLAPLAVPEAQYVAWRNSVTAGQNIETRLADVQYKGMERVNPEYLKQRAQVKPGDTVNTAKISAEAQRMSALQDFESVEYRLTGDPDSPTLEWWPKESRYGPNYLKFDLGLYGSEGGDLGFVVYGKHTRTWMNSLGAEWRNEVQLGYFNNLSTSFYQPLDIAQRFFVEPKIFWTRSWEDVFVDNERLARYKFSDWGGKVDVGVNLQRRRAGARGLPVHTAQGERRDRIPDPAGGRTRRRRACVDSDLRQPRHRVQPHPRPGSRAGVRLHGRFARRRPRLGAPRTRGWIGAADPQRRGLDDTGRWNRPE